MDDSLARLEASWKVEQEKAAAAQVIEDHRTELYSLCNAEVDLGIIHKRGGSRVEAWQARRMTLQCGRLCYFAEGFFGRRLKGWTHLYDVRTERVAVDRSTAADRDFCLDVNVLKPKARVYLFSFGSADDLERFERLIALHRQFCELFPQLVMDPP
jgi:hypothetical protein